MERPEYSRRDFLKLFGLTTLGAVTQGLTACTSPQVENSSVLPQKTKTLPELRAENQATIELIKEKPPITQEVFDEITGAMGKSSSLLLQMLSGGIRSFWSAVENPPETPSWFDQTLTPFVITCDEDETSFMKAQPLFCPDNFFIYARPDLQNPGSKVEIICPEISTVNVGIHLGFFPFAQDEGSLAGGFFLAKEWLNFVGLKPIAQKMVDLYRQRNLVDFLEHETRLPVTDQTEKEIVGISLFILDALYREEGQDHSKIWHLFDGFPVLLIATQIYDLVNRGEIPRSTMSIGAFFIAAELIENPKRKNLKEKLIDFINRWSASGSTFPPDDFLPLMYDPDVFSTLSVLEDKIQAYQASGLCGRFNFI